MSKDNKTARREQYITKRKTLIAISQGIRMMVKEGVYDTVNEGLREMYEENDPEILEFNTFNQWKEKGCTVKKGSKAFLFWGQPRKASQTPEGSNEPEEYKYWPLCYLFADTQVHKNESNTTTMQPEKQMKQKRNPEPVEELDELLN